MTIRWLIINRATRDGAGGWFLADTEFRIWLKRKGSGNRERDVSGA
jgi:hypothetical protein